MNRSLPTRELRDHPDLDQLKQQAKELLDTFRAGDPAAAVEVHTHYRGADAMAFALHDAQLVIARAYGFESWPKLKAYVDGVTVKRLADAIRLDDHGAVRAMLKRRPELAHMSLDNLQVVHFAVLNRAAEMTRLLMQYGANAREGVYPHRDATTPHAIAVERGYAEIAAIIEEEEQRRRDAKTGIEATPAPDEIFSAIRSGDTEHAIRLMEATPALVRSCHAGFGWTPLHIAARTLNERLVRWLLDRGADAAARGWHDITAIDMAANFSDADSAQEFATVAALLTGRGADLTPRAAVALGDAGWLRGRHADGTLSNPIEDTGGLLRIAASHNRADILALLLDFGFDPDERTRFGDGDGHTFTWGMPLYHCAGAGKYEMAEMLLQRGADPNAAVYASGDPVFQAYSRQDWKMVELLGRYGGVPNATTAGLYRQTELARKMLAGEVKYRLDSVGGTTLAEQLLWGGACGGDPEIVRMALERVDWPRVDLRWFEILEQPLRIWSHGPASPDGDRGAYLVCFRRVLERCDPNVRGRVPDQGQFGLTILHSVAGSRDHVLPDERKAFATMLLDAGARVDLRDNLLNSTPLGWACRWGRVELVELLLQRGADPVEEGAEPWATPKAWAEKMRHANVLALLQTRAAGY